MIFNAFRIVLLLILISGLVSFNYSAFAQESVPEAYCKNIDEGNGELCRPCGSNVVLKGQIGGFTDTDAICKPCGVSTCEGIIQCSTIEGYPGCVE